MLARKIDLDHSRPATCSGSIGRTITTCKASIMQETLKITGMQSSDCAASVTRALQSLPGVANVDVNLSCHKAVVDFDENRTSRQELVATVKKAGYGIIGARAVDLSGNGGGSCCGGCCS
jgi:copper chaperone CopZ